MKLLGYGLTQEQISGELGVTPLTVRYYVHCIHKKTQVKGRGNIILLALRAGVTSLWSRHPLETEKHGKAHR